MPQIFVFAIGKRDKQAQRNLASFWCEIGGEGLGMASVCFESVAHRFCPSPGSHLPGDGA
jgi:hypothetical protein